MSGTQASQALDPSLADLLRRDAAVIAGVEKLRFSPLAVSGGKGSYLFEAGGRKLLDLSASWTAAGLGYGHSAVVAAVLALSLAACGSSDTASQAANGEAGPAAVPQVDTGWTVGTDDNGAFQLNR